MEHISKRFGSFYANKDISLTVNCGEVLILSPMLSHSPTWLSAGVLPEISGIHGRA